MGRIKTESRMGSRACWTGPLVLSSVTWRKITRREAGAQTTEQQRAANPGKKVQWIQKSVACHARAGVSYQSAAGHSSARHATAAVALFLTARPTRGAGALLRTTQ